MYRQQLTILRKEFLASAAATLLLLAGAANVQAATVIVDGSDLFGGGWTNPADAASGSGNVQQSLFDGTVYQQTNMNVTGAVSIKAGDYAGATLTADTTMTFDTSLNLPAKLNVAAGVNVSFAGTTGSVLTITQTAGLNSGSTITVDSGTLKFQTAAPTTSTDMYGNQYANTVINENGTLWMDQQRGANRNYGKLTINGGTLIVSRQLIMFGCGNGTSGGITEMSGNAQIQIASSGDLRFFGEKSAVSTSLNITGTNANARITGYNGTKGTLHLNNAANDTDFYMGNYVFNVVDVFSKLTIDVNMIGEVGTTGNVARGGITKAGEGTLVISGSDNKIAGATIIKAGTLELTDGAKLYNCPIADSSAAFTAFVAAYKAGTTPNYDTYYKSSMVVIGTGANSTAVLRVSNIMTALGDLPTARRSIILDGGTLSISGASQSMSRNFTVGTNGGTVIMEKAGETLTIVSNTTNGYYEEMYGNLTYGGAGNIYVDENSGNNDWIANTGSITKVGSGTLTLAGLNQYTGSTTVNEGTLKLTGTLYNLIPNVPAGLTMVDTTIRVGKTTQTDGTVSQGTFEITTFGALQLGNLNVAGSAFVIDGGRLVVAGNSQTARAFTMTTNGGTIEMAKEGQTLTVNQNIVPEQDAGGSPVNFQGNTIEVGGAGNITMGAGFQIKAMNGTLLKTGSGTFTTTFLADGMSGMDIIVREGTFVVAGNRNESANWANSITIEEGAVMTVNQPRALGRHTDDFTMKTGSTLNVNNGVFMPANNRDFVTEGTAAINIAGQFNSINTTIKVQAGTDATGVAVNGNVNISGNGTLNISSDQKKLGFNVVGAKDRLTVDAKFTQDDKTAGYVATKSGDGIMVQNWVSGSNYAGVFNVNAGTYAASGAVTAQNLNVNGGTGYIADGGSAAGNVYVAAPAAFSAGYTAANDGRILNSVGEIDVNGNMRIAGRLIVDVVEGQKDVINVGGTITLDDTFKFVVNVDAYDSYAGWTDVSVLDGEYDAQTLDMLQGMLEDGTLLEHFETNAGSLTMLLDENGNPVLADLNAIPEPAAWTLLLLGIAGLGFVRKRNALKK